MGDDEYIVKKLKQIQPNPPIDTSTITDEVIDNTSSLPRGECTGVLKPENSPAPTPTTDTPNPTPSGPTPAPTPTDDDEECTFPGSSCFRVHKWGGCDDQACEDKVCNVFKRSCCNKTFNKKCKNKANKLCNKCECDEDPSALFFKNKKAGQPVLKSCDWLDGQPTNKKQKFCRKYASFGDYDPARITCPLACDLKFCQNDQSIF